VRATNICNLAYHRSVWSDPANVELLKQLWGDGLSASQIANQIGGVTRSAIIGKANRLGLSGRVVPLSFAKRQHNKPKPRRPNYQIGNPGLRRLYLVPSAPVPFQELDIPLAERKTVPTLEDKDCRWPIGDPQHPDFHFCGRPKITGLPYCDHHSRVAFQPPQAYRRPPPAERIPTFSDAEREDA
jgi:GcrA cell cycle regulator